MLEIEKKYLIDCEMFDYYRNNLMFQVLDYILIDQAYLLQYKNYVLRTRVATTVKSKKATLTFKTPNVGITRTEIEITIPVFLAKLLGFGRSKLCKRRTVLRLTEDGSVWEVDKFLNLKQPLHLAEIELESENSPHHIPPWVVKEVSDDVKYYNSNLIKEIK